MQIAGKNTGPLTADLPIKNQIRMPGRLLPEPYAPCIIQRMRIWRTLWLVSLAGCDTDNSAEVVADAGFDGGNTAEQTPDSAGESDDDDDDNSDEADDEDDAGSIAEDSDDDDMVDADEPGPKKGDAGTTPAPECAGAELSFSRIVLEPASDGDKRYGKAIGDLSGDGLPDVFLGSAAGMGLHWYEYPDWDKHSIRASGTWSENMQLADVDGDGDTDLIAGNAQSVNWYENPAPDADPRSPDWVEHRIGSDGTNVHDLEVGDLNGDKRLDVVIRYEKENDLPALAFLQLDSGWSEGIAVNEDERSAEGLGLGDVDHDEDLDIVVQHYWYENDGTGETWTAHAYSTGQSDQMLIQVADLDGDGRHDIVVCPQGAGTAELAWFSSPDPTGTWTAHTLRENVSRMHGLAVADFNNDGHLDLHTSLRHDVSGDANVSVWLSDGSQPPSFEEQVLATSGSHYSKVGDIGGDGDSDIVGANWGDSDPLELWENGCVP